MCIEAMQAQIFMKFHNFFILDEHLDPDPDQDPDQYPGGTNRIRCFGMLVVLRTG
jgi:hypothetical protein